MDLPEITEVQRLTIRPGDTLVIKLAVSVLDRKTADDMTGQLREFLELDPSIKILILPQGDSLSVLETEQPDGH